MPAPNAKIVRLYIKVTLTGTPSFDVLAGDQQLPAGLPYFCDGGQGASDQALLKEILGKIIAAYSVSPITLCIEDPQILPMSACAGGGGVPLAIPQADDAAAKKRATSKHSAKKTGRKRTTPKGGGR